MARWLIDCRPLCGRPWRLGLAEHAEEVTGALRLRHDIFFRECGYGPVGKGIDVGEDRDEFDDWCQHLIIQDESTQQVIGTCRAILGPEATRRGGFYAGSEFDLAPLAPIASGILEIGRTCVHADQRDGPAFQYLSYGAELLLREAGLACFLGAESFRVRDQAELDFIGSYLDAFGRDDAIAVSPHPPNQAPFSHIAVQASQATQLPAILRLDLRMGFLAIAPPAWDPGFRCYDVLMLGRRARLTPTYEAFLKRIERSLPGNTHE